MKDGKLKGALKRCVRAAWTLEWMILPGMAAATAAALKLGARLVASIERIGG